MTKVVFMYENKPNIEFECKECMIYGNIAALKGVKDSTAKIVRIPLFNIVRMDVFD